MKPKGPLTGWLFAFLVAVFIWSPLPSAADQEGTLVIALDTLGGQTMPVG